jgi:hypothetical protein
VLTGWSDEHDDVGVCCKYVELMELWFNIFEAMWFPRDELIDFEHCEAESMRVEAS